MKEQFRRENDTMLSTLGFKNNMGGSMAAGFEDNSLPPLSNFATPDKTK